MVEEAGHVAHGKSDDDAVIMIKKSALWRLSTAILSVLLVASILTGGFGWKSSPDDEKEEAREVEPAGANVAGVDVGDAPVKGDVDAPVTIIEFSDFSCPFCGAASGKTESAVEYMKSRDSSWEAPVPAIIKNYVANGKARLVFKYFPGHGTGLGAMKLAWCADEQGKFWEVHDAFFENQGAIDDAEKLKDIAVEAGVERAKLEECYESGRHDSRLASDANEGRAAGVSGTPTFLINGARVSGAQSFPAFSRVIDAALEQAD